MFSAAPDVIRRHLDKVLASGQLGKSETSRRLLSYLVERSLRNDAPKETELAIDVFGRDASFNGAEDSLVRVAVRTLRQKLAEYYVGPGSQDEIRFVIPKGGYRLSVEPRTETPVPMGVSPSAPVTDSVTETPSSMIRGPRVPLWALALAAALFGVSLLANAYLWRNTTENDPAASRVRQSPVWADLDSSPRTLMIVLGDLFMYTQIDPQTGRTLTVRDPEINSSEELRAFLASHPSLTAERGQRYTTLIPKSAAVGMAAILPLVARPGRRIEVRILDELQVDDIRNNDVVFVGPLVRLGPLAGHYLLRSRYRYDAGRMSLTDTISRRTFLPEGALANQRMDYGLAAKFAGPTGNHIMIFASVGRNAGLLQIVRTLTSPEGLEALDAKLRAQARGMPESFEALLAVTGFKRTDLAAEIIDVHALPATSAEQQPSSGATGATQ